MHIWWCLSAGWLGLVAVLVGFLLPSLWLRWRLFTKTSRQLLFPILCSSRKVHFAHNFLFLFSRRKFFSLVSRFAQLIYLAHLWSRIWIYRNRPGTRMLLVLKRCHICWCKLLIRFGCQALQIFNWSRAFQSVISGPPYFFIFWKIMVLSRFIGNLWYLRDRVEGRHRLQIWNLFGFSAWLFLLRICWWSTERTLLRWDCTGCGGSWFLGTEVQLILDLGWLVWWECHYRSLYIVQIFNTWFVFGVILVSRFLCVIFRLHLFFGLFFISFQFYFLHFEQWKSFCFNIRAQVEQFITNDWFTS